jgi:hypothetical protein
MTCQKYFLLFLFLLMSIFAPGQNQKASDKQKQSANIIFKDTLFNIAFDSVSHDLGMIKPTNENNKLVKYFKNIGRDTIVIARAWSGDPHYICEYPKEPLLPNRIYSFTVCFWHEGRQGNLNKTMGFDFSNGNKVSLKFSGKYLPVENVQTKSVDSLNYEKIIISQAQIMGQLLLKKNFNAFVKYTYPKVVEMMGGETKMIEVLEKGSKQMESEGVKFLNVTIGQPSKIIAIDNELQCTLPETIEMKVPGGKLITRSTLIFH